MKKPLNNMQKSLRKYWANASPERRKQQAEIGTASLAKSRKPKRGRLSRLAAWPEDFDDLK